MPHHYSDAAHSVRGQYVAAACRVPHAARLVVDHRVCAMAMFLALFIHRAGSRDVASRAISSNEQVRARKTKSRVYMMHGVHATHMYERMADAAQCFAR